jgi:hypothetical protein
MPDRKQLIERLLVENANAADTFAPVVPSHLSPLLAEAADLLERDAAVLEGLTSEGAIKRIREAVQKLKTYSEQVCTECEERGPCEHEVSETAAGGYAGYQKWRKLEIKRIECVDKAAVEAVVQHALEQLEEGDPLGESARDQPLPPELRGQH